MLTIPEHETKLVASGKSSRSGEQIKKPQSVLDYNNAKKGVDLSDQMSFYYIPLKKTRKWYRKVAFKLIAGISCVNTWILYNKFYCEKPIPFRCFKESLIMSLTKGVPKEDLKLGKRSRNVTDPGHKLVEADSPQKKLRKRCKRCYEIISQNEGRNEASKKAKKV